MLLSISMNKACTVLKKFKITHSNLHSGTRSRHLCPVSHSNTHIYGPNLLVLATSINSSLNKEKSTKLKKNISIVIHSHGMYFYPCNTFQTRVTTVKVAQTSYFFSCYKKHK